MMRWGGWGLLLVAFIITPSGPKVTGNKPDTPAYRVCLSITILHIEVDHKKKEGRFAGSLVGAIILK